MTGASSSSALLSQSCFECIVSTMETLPDGIAAYGAIDECAASAGVKYAHEGSPGMLILSKKPLENVSLVEHETYLIPRRNIFATVSGVRMVFANWPKNVLQDINPSLAPLQTGLLQPDLAIEVIVGAPKLALGNFNSGADYQSAGADLLKSNGYKPLISKPTYCPAATHASFPPCQNAELVGQTSIDNIYLRNNAGYCVADTFAKDPISDHIGVSAICLVKTK